MEKYTEKKLKNQVIQTFAGDHVTERTKNRIENCATYLEFFANKDMTKRRLRSANFCKWRFCPMCAWRKARQDANRISVLMKYIAEEHDKVFVFLTLTAPNVKAEDLRDEITRFNKAMHRLMHRAEVKRVNQGCMRKLEVTYNPGRDDYHPHFHVVMAVNKSYFKSRDYLKQSRWLELWQESMRDESITQVDIRRVTKPRSDADHMSRDGFSVSEFAKYAAKDEDYGRNQDVFKAFHNALRGRQCITYHGLFKEANKKYKDGELNEYKESDLTEYYWKLVYGWRNSMYNEDEKALLNILDKAYMERNGINVYLEWWEKAAKDCEVYVPLDPNDPENAEYVGIIAGNWYKRDDPRAKAYLDEQERLSRLAEESRFDPVECTQLELDLECASGC